MPAHPALAALDVQLSARVDRFDGSRRIARAETPLMDADRNTIDRQLVAHDARWDIALRAAPAADRAGAVDLLLVATPDRAIAQANVSLILDVAWSLEAYLGIPAAAYAGNRFRAKVMPYAPLVGGPSAAPGESGSDAIPVISDVPRLTDGPGSSIRLMSRDCATPAIGWRVPGRAQGGWLLADHRCEHGDLGLAVEEADDRARARLVLSAPGVRELTRYRICTTAHPSTDRGADLAAGQPISIRARLVVVAAPDVPALWRAFVPMRHDLLAKGGPAPCLPFGAAFEIQRAKYAACNWVEEYGYYSVGLRENRHQDWQPGWVGGLMATLPLLRDGGALDRARVARNFDFMFPRGLGASGLCHGTWHAGVHGGDGFDHAHAATWTLTRKSADVLYFALKQFAIMDGLAPGWVVPAAWADGVRRIADAFVKLWRNHRQFGQFVDVESGAITVGGSASAAIAIGGLALAWRRFGDARYRAVAEEAAEAFAGRFLATGFTSGGPGEALQCPDSESAFALLDGYLALIEATDDARWLGHARAAADQCASWVTSYDYAFPPSSTFGRLGMRSTGSVWANVQNKHAAPAICTLSGDSLLKLFRATGEIAYLDLLVEIARGVTQYLSRADRPIHGMPPGFMNERVNLSDWLEPIGEIFAGSCWCEVSCLLAWSELPGVYVRRGGGVLRVLDHVEAELREGATILRLRNPTAFATEVTVMCESETEARTRWLGPVPLTGCRRVPLPAGGFADIRL